VAEADNMAKGDGIRYQSGTVNITGRDFLTMEAITGPTIGYAGMDDVITELGQNYSDGVNRAILHGTPYAKTFNGYNSDWPGWLPFGPSSFGSDYTYRNAYWDDIPAETGYMSRVQAVLQNGAALIDLAALVDKEHTYDFESGNRFQNLLDAGYSYNLVSEATLAGANAVVEGGRLAPDGPAYKALIVDKVSILSLAGIWRLVDYANGGLPIVVFDSEISRVFGSRTEDDAAVQTKFTELKGLPTVKTASTEAEIKDALAELGVVSYARYDAARLETTLYADPEDGTAYYYMFNNAYPENSGMMGNNQGAYYKGEDKYVRDAMITLAGEGVPYLLDPHSGDIVPTAYTDNGDGTVTITLDWLAGGDSIIIAVTTDTQNFPASKPIPAKKAALDAVDLSGGLWDLTIHSYGPDEDSSDPSVSKITVVDFGEQPLGKWKDIPATAEQLARLGVSDMRYVSGAGYYTAAFDAPDSWSGAYLDVAYGIDQIGSITINGTAIPANNASDRVDLGGLVMPGENTITVKLTTSLYGRMFVENSGYANSEYGMGGGFMAPVDPESYYNGLLSAKLVPYTLE
jgi:hypothetical protein